MKLLLVITFLVAFAGFTPVLAADYQRNVDVEWEPIEGAGSYEVEFLPEVKGEGQKQKVILHRVKEAAFAGKMIPGKYKMRVRAKDPRGVAGEWSGYEEFMVQLENVKLIAPKSNVEIAAKDAGNFPVDFEWAPLGGATAYRLEIYSDDKVTQITQNVRDTSVRVNLPAAAKYTWKVTGLQNKLESEATSVDQFTLFGKKLEKPVIQKQFNSFVRDVQWSAPDFAAAYSYRLIRYDAKAKQWVNVASNPDFTSTTIPFDPTWPGGKYKISVQAKGNMRETSDPAIYAFPVRNGDRSPAAELNSTMRKAIVRTDGHFAIASYLISTINYRGSSMGGLNAISYNAVGGTGRVGYGYLSGYKPWGFLGIVDYSGWLIGQTNYVYANAELNGVHRRQIGERGEVRQQFGLFYKELPETVGNNITGISKTNSIKGAGPHYGVEYWYAMSDKIGLQLNAHFYPSLFKISTPNGERMSPRMSYQVGILGSYKLSKNMTGLIGYANKTDEMAYHTTPEPLLDLTGAETNDVTVEGHYLNLFLEWAL